MLAVWQLLSLLVSVLVLPLSAILLVAAVTWEGRGFAMGTLSVVGALLMAAFGPAATRGRRCRIAVGLGLAGIALVAIVVSRAPSGAMPATARVHHLYAADQSHSRWRIANVVPEVDQFMVGFAVMPFIDPLLTHRQAVPLKRWTQEVYHEMEADAEFRALGSAMSHAYADLRGGTSPKHAFLYVPHTVDRSRPAPALLFFHGSGGNFKAYLWLLSKLADRLKMVVIAPSGGMGDWSATETAARVSGALTAAQRIVPIDSARIHAIGLSNGGLALSHLIRAVPHEYRSFVFLSPVFHDSTVRDLAFTSMDRKPVVLIITGTLDDRVPLPYVESRVADLTRAGVTATLEATEDANHFLLFSHREQVVSRLERWLVNFR